MNSSTPTTRGRPTRLNTERLFQISLLLVAVAALIPRLLIGSSQFINYDGYWHIFAAMQDRWDLFLSEWRVISHPILYYPILRFAAQLGRTHLMYRAPSIIPGVITVYLVGKTAARIYEQRIPALLAAAAYGFSRTIVELNCDVRAYSLALLFIVAALYYFVLFVNSRFDPKNCKLPLVFAALTALAIGCEYYAVFFLAGSLTAIAGLIVCDSEFREAARTFWRRKRVETLLGLALPLSVFLFLYYVHVRSQPPILSDTFQFKDGSVTRFIVSNLGREFSYLSPIPLSSTAAISLLLFIIALTISQFVFLKTRGRASVRFSLLLLLLAILFELILLGATGRYWFGGEARQQSIIFPFVILTAFLCLDFAFRLARSRCLTRGLTSLVMLAITVNFTFWWHTFPRMNVALFTAEYKQFCEKMPPQTVVYVDQYSFIAYYVHTNRWRWSTERVFGSKMSLYEYRTKSRNGCVVHLLRNRSQWNFDLFKPAFYTTLRDVLRETQLKGADLFFIKQVPQPIDLTMQHAAEDQIRALAAKAGLQVHALHYTNAEAFIAFVAR